ncbi:hypothetical protein E2C01_006754 [Portunus trituberculatus]|uniref:Uncharacterized protein n=1 Tax=Portunus trituberculatus TaxID=210409 RepID=A0A5B7CYP2_PORTR|nr:hypothetical protein [Portunus trituberculatus]
MEAKPITALRMDHDATISALPSAAPKAHTNSCTRASFSRNWLKRKTTTSLRRSSSCGALCPSLERPSGRARATSFNMHRR